MADILDLVDVEELRNEVQKKYRAVAEKPEASSGYDRAILDQLREEACERSRAADQGRLGEDPLSSPACVLHESETRLPLSHHNLLWCRRLISSVACCPSWMSNSS